MPVDPYIPLEDEEQATFVQWLELQGLKFTAVPNSTYTTSWKQKSKNHRTGLRAGFPDLVVLIPPDASVTGEGYFLCIEMKRVKGGTVSKEQAAWRDSINGLDAQNVAAYVCKGAQEAIDLVTKHLAGGLAKTVQF